MSTQTAVPPNDIRSRALDDIRMALISRDLPRAIEIADFSVRRGIRDPEFLQIRARCLQDAERYEEAIAGFRRAMPAPRQDPAILTAIGDCLMGLERRKEAFDSFAAAVAIAPNFPEGHFKKGLAAAMDGNHEEAQRAYERAIELTPNHADALANLAAVLARKGDDRAAMLARRALQLHPHAIMAKVALATLASKDRNFVEAERLLREVLAGEHLDIARKTPTLTSLADALDGQGRYAESFAVCAELNRETRERNADKFPDRENRQATQLAAYFESASPERWARRGDYAALPEAAARHVFLLGFMRSGTTLLEQVLGSHPEVVALEEKPLLMGFRDRFMSSNFGLDSLGMLGGNELQVLRRSYWNAARDHAGDVAGKVFLDKQPLNTVNLPLISKLFPDAKVLFAIRDPRDVVLSCFRRHFKINPMTFEFLALEDAATAYAAVMRMAEVYRARLPLDVLDHRYEDLVADFDGQVRKVCEFIGIPWSDDMRRFHKLAPAVDLRSPSATQVTRPLYAEGVSHWRNYAEQLAPVLPILEPWVRKFGYSAA